MEKVLIFACLTWASLTFNTCYAQNPEQYLPTFNIARDKEVTVNATCGGDLGGQTETYCKLVGYDSFFVKSSNQILSGQVKIHSIPLSRTTSMDGTLKLSNTKAHVA